MSVDPLMGATGETYGYAGEDPVNAGDPGGMCGCQDTEPPGSSKQGPGPGQNPGGVMPPQPPKDKPIVKPPPGPNAPPPGVGKGPPQIWIPIPGFPFPVWTPIPVKPPPIKPKPPPIIIAGGCTALGSVS